MRKSIQFKVLAILVLVAFASCSSSGVKEPEQIGKQAFKILKNVSDGTKKDYVNCFISIDQIHEMGENDELIRDDEARDELLDLDEDDITPRIKRSYNNIKEEGAEEGIKWSEIEYLDFIYNMEEDDGLEFCMGQLYFSFDDERYKINTRSIFNGSGYLLVSMDGLRRQ